jgi:phosphomannomutase/phosphoglucomutase
VSEKTSPLSRLIAELPTFTMYQEKRKTTRAKEIVAHMRKYFADFPIDERDGIRITRGGAWALIRPSGTEPLVRVFTESQNPAEAKTLLGEILAEINPYLE